MTIEIPRLLLVDSYDSFTYNLAALCRQAIPNCSIYIIKNDEYTLEQLLPLLSYFSAIIVGPGPGSPDNDGDIGVVKKLWKVKEKHIIPIFGVCLGLQSLGVVFGARLQRLHCVKHGQVSDIHHIGTDLFEDVGSVRAVRYHSLHVGPLEDGEIEELAWADDEENGRVVMAIKHKTRPFWAVQYHPESVCTDGGGVEVLQNFWLLAQSWSKMYGRQVRPWNAAANSAIARSWPFIPPHSPPPTPLAIPPTVLTSSLDLPRLSTAAVCEMFGALDDSCRFALLDSAAQPGRFSIVACLMPTSLQITYSVHDSFVCLTSGNITVREELGSSDISTWLATFIRSRKVLGGQAEVPFWGGLVGYLSYEFGVRSLDIPLKERPGAGTRRHPDVNLVFVERSIVLDSVTGKVFVQSIMSRDDEWLSETCTRLLRATADHRHMTESEEPSCQPYISQATISLPDKSRYISRINQAKEHLFAGDSYELCLTAQTRISIPQPALSSWERYKQVRKNNPAPHSAFLRLHPTTLISSSPERFLSYSRPPGSVCQLRPIKGTVRKGPGITRAVAEEALAGSVKEVAENLMIVDLIRHDLHGVVGEDVSVKQFCGVEEYETVWQLVSVIEGKANSQAGMSLNVDDELGWEVLRRSLPPGSMTGAPKKRSVEILQTLEDGERNVYSGIFGYWCVGGGGDWSVAIRSCFKYDILQRGEGGLAPEQSDRQGSSEEWIIGAGGAITALSTAEAEWDEMLLKLQSVLRSFGEASIPET